MLNQVPASPLGRQADRLPKIPSESLSREGEAASQRRKRQLTSGEGCSAQGPRRAAVPESRLLPALPSPCLSKALGTWTLCLN